MSAKVGAILKQTRKNPQSVSGDFSFAYGVCFLWTKAERLIDNFTYSIVNIVRCFFRDILVIGILQSTS